jgi:D-alanyl-D-alanine dipeptidase
MQLNYEKGSEQMQRCYKLLLINCLTLLSLFASVRLQGHELVSLSSINPQIKIDMRYASCNNPMGYPLYPFAGCFVVAEVAEKLSKVQKLLEREGYGLKVFDAYRPYHLFTCSGYASFGEKIPDFYVLEDNCGHSRGTAVDVALVTEDGVALDMGSDFGCPLPHSSRDCNTLSGNAYHNRCILERAMTRYGFISTRGNWWHYDYASCSLYPLLDVSFWEIY